MGLPEVPERLGRNEGRHLSVSLGREGSTEDHRLVPPAASFQGRACRQADRAHAMAAVPLVPAVRLEGRSGKTPVPEVIHGSCKEKC